MIIEYKKYDEFPGWGGAPELIRSIIDEYKVKDILEIGSGANPTIEPDYIFNNYLNYTTNDIFEEELNKAHYNNANFD